MGECVDCTTEKGLPLISGELQGVLQATYILKMIAMNHIPSLPRSFKRNPESLMWMYLFSGYAIARESASRTTQTIARCYEECVFRRFGKNKIIRHDREPEYMSDFFQAERLKFAVNTE